MRLLQVAIAALWLAPARAEEIRDFIAVNALPDGEVETRVYYRGASAKETAVGRGSATDIKFRQLAPDHRHLIQLIYDGDELRDCEILHGRQQVQQFLNSFKSDLTELVAGSNISITSLDDTALPTDISLWFNYTQLKNSCRKLHEEMKRALHDPHRWREKRSVFIMPGTLWCGDSHAATKYTRLGTMVSTDRCCRRHDYCKLDIPGLSAKFHYYNHSPFTISHCRCDARCWKGYVQFREKREIFDVLRVPGTKWCGKGYSAEKYTRLGGFSRTDKCCRRHDMSCPFWIGAFDTKYGLFNWRVNTIMHCSCDERFRACLKMVDSGDANLVGKLFFNVVQTKCFVLKPRKRCTKKSWWGQCEKYKYEKHAILRDNLPY